MRDVSLILEEVLPALRPDGAERERIMGLAEGLMKRLGEEVLGSGLDIEVRLEGSVAKGTWIRGEADLDIFLRFPRGIDRETFRKKALEIGKGVLREHRPYERYSEHPYVEAVVDGVVVDIVPCYRVEPGDWLSSTDRTPYHTQYVIERLGEREKDEVRLLKRFLKANGLYGADAKVRGFSGMLCETLILKYGSFASLLEGASAWGRPEIIDVEGHYSGREGEAGELFREPLIVIDPVDRNRNLASALSEENLWRFVALARAFLEEPSRDFFFPREAILGPRELGAELARRGSCLAILAFGRADAVVDVVWSQLRKSEAALRRALEREGFKVYRASAWTDEEYMSAIAFELEAGELPPLELHMGPPVLKGADSERFLRKHRGAEDTVGEPWVRGDRWAVEKLRRLRRVEDALEEFVKGGGGALGIPKRIADAIERGHEILINDRASSLLEGNPKFGKFLADFLSGWPRARGGLGLGR
ncbi:MAG: CCA tRNA nucleotidyltransferase [Candidatus Bathyarchaeia archaeon]